MEYGLRQGMTVSAGMEDSSRAELSFLIEVVNTLYKEGIRRFRYADTVSAHHPGQMAERVSRLLGEVPGDVELEVHCHNDFGLACANTLSGIAAGAVWASTTVAGIGERTGNAAMEEVAMAWRYLYGGNVRSGWRGSRASQTRSLPHPAAVSAMRSRSWGSSPSPMNPGFMWTG